MRAIRIIAGKELRDALRNRWVLATSLLLGALALSLAFLGSSPVGSVDASRLSITIVSLSSLTIFLCPLIALMLAHDAIIGDLERGTLMLTLTYPVSHWELILGKFFGHVLLLAITITVGYGSAAVAVALTGDVISGSEWMAYGTLIGTSILLGVAFLGMGYVVSVSVNERATAAGITVGVWLLFVVLYDMALLGIVVMDQGASIRADVFNMIMLANPADAFRVFNLTHSSTTASLSGMAAVAGKAALPASASFMALCIWAVVPISLAGILFTKKEI